MSGSTPIRRLDIRNHRLSLAEAEVWITVISEDVTPAAEVRGRMVGPQCAYASTVEVAYPLRPLPRRPEGVPEPTVRAIIPEPSLWDPQSPFLYQVTVELWSEGECRTRERVRHGLRELQLSSHGLRCNGRPLPLRGVRWRSPPPTFQPEPVQEQKASIEHLLANLRQRGVNLLIVPAEEGSDRLWSAADELGFLILYRLSATNSCRRLALSLIDDSCFLGWIMPSVSAADLNLADLVQAAGSRSSGLLLGLELEGPPTDPLPAAVRFVLCPEEWKDHPHVRGMPKLLYGREGAAGEDANVLGRIDK